MSVSTSILSPNITSTSPASTSCVSAMPGKNGYVPPTACNALYGYYPSFAAAIIFGLLFGIATVAHLIQAISYRKKFCWVIIMGASWETVAFVLRTLGTKHQQNVAFVTVSQILVLLAPLWINAFDYMILGRMVYYFLPERSILHVHASKFSKYFVWLDILSFIVQAAGGIILSGQNESAHLMDVGKDIYMSGIGMQQFFILVFFMLAIQFHRRVLVLERQDVLISNGKTEWRRLLYTLYASLILITIRVIFRLAEFSRGTGTNNPIPYHEAYMYSLDALPMALALYIMVLAHPAQTLIGPDSEFPKLTRAEKKQAKQAKKIEKLEMKAAKKRDRGEAGHMQLADVELGQDR